MANQELLACLRGGVVDWNAWRSANPMAQINLRGADLRGADLRGADLRGADLREANLFAFIDKSMMYPWLPPERCEEADLQDADLREALLSDLDLSGLNLSGADLRKADLSRANLLGSDLSSADLRGADLRDADLREVRIFVESDGPTPMQPHQEIVKSELTQLKEANLRGANLSGLDLCGFNLRNTNLEKADLSHADLRQVDLKSVKLSQANLSQAKISTSDLSGINLRGAKLNGLHLSGCDLSRADLEATNLQGVDLKRAILKGANLRGANLRGADLREADLRRIDLSNADLRGANLIGLDLSGFRLSGADLRELDLNRFELRRADLQKSCLEGVSLAEADLSGADLTKANLKKTQLTQANLQGANLRGAALSTADLTDSNLVRADLEEADLYKAELVAANLRFANLSFVNLTKAQVLHADLSGAILTGACLKDWNTNLATNLCNAQAEYIYLDRPCDGGSAKEKFFKRRPHSGNFTPGEFAALFQQALDTLDLIFVDGIDWQAFFVSFQELRQQYNDSDLTIQAIEKKSGGSFVVRLEVSDDVDKAAIEESAKAHYANQLQLMEASYKAQLQIKDSEIESYKRENTNMLEITKLLASKPINVEAKAMSSSDQFTNNFEGTTIGNFANKLSDNASQNYTSGSEQSSAEIEPELTTILFLAANPVDMVRLRLGEELREIDESLKRSKQRDQFNLVNKGAVRTRDFYRAILETQPKIVHFSGHGTDVDGLALEDEQGNAKFMGAEPLAALFELFAEEGVECVLLNACYSKEQAAAIRQHIPHVIGMNQAITDKAGIIFAVAFYDSLGAGKDVNFAFKLAKSQLIDLGEHKIPQLL